MEERNLFLPFVFTFVVCVCKPFNEHRQSVQSRNTFGPLTVCFVYVICINIRANVAVWIALQDSNCRTICGYVVQEMRARGSCYYREYSSHRCVLRRYNISRYSAVNVHGCGNIWSPRDTWVIPTYLTSIRRLQ